jgi:hypothetical protein
MRTRRPGSGTTERKRRRMFPAVTDVTRMGAACEENFQVFMLVNLLLQQHQLFRPAIGH